MNLPRKRRFPFRTRRYNMRVDPKAALPALRALSGDGQPQSVVLRAGTAVVTFHAAPPLSAHDCAAAEALAKRLRRRPPEDPT